MNRWIFPLLGAAALHAALFTMDLGFSPPTLLIPDSKTVTISLVAAPPAPAVPAPAPAPELPKTVPAPKPPPKKKRVKALKPKPAVAPQPLPQEPVLPEPVRADPAKADPASSADDAPLPDQKTFSTDPATETAPTDQARIQASVPLYHLNPPPTYPAVARRRNYQGTTLLDVLVDSQGRAAQVRVNQSSGFAILDRSAVTAVRQWRFEPARRRDRPVEMWVQVPVKFELK